MGKLENIQDKLNQFLRKRDLPRIKEQAKNIYMLFELTLRSVWTIEDKEQRESIAVDIAQALKPYFGGKRIEDALDEISDKLNKEEKQEDIQEEKQAEIDNINELKKRLKDPNYVPTFEELMKIKNKKAGK